MAKEEKIPNYIDFPYEIFLMLRLEFLALCQDEVEAKIMRIIEKAVNDEWESIYRERCATTPKNEPVEMPEEVWVVIPNRYFLDRLLGTVQSESTLKAMMKSLVQKKKLVFRHERPGRYDAPEYTLNKKALTEFFATLPSDPRQVDMMAIMKQERKNSKKKDNQEGQKLAPSKIDPLITERVKNWLPQKLTPSASKIDPLVERGGGQKLTPTYISLDDNLNDKSKSATSRDDCATPSSSFAKGDDDDNGAIHRGTDATGSSRMVREISDQHLQHASGDTLTVGGNQQQTSNAPSIETGDDDGNNGANTVPHRPDHHSSVNDVIVPVDIRHSEEIHGQPTSTVETSEVWRKTNPPTPLTENIVSTDEPSREIERETAERASSSAVVDMQKDAVVYDDARNTTNSYSPPSTASPESVTATEMPKSDEVATQTGKGSGKGKGGKKAAKLDLSPIAPPARPEPDLPFNAEKILAWGNYGRKAMLPESNRRDSRAFKAIEAARKIEGFGISEDLFLTLYFNWMKGVKVDLTDLPEDAMKSDTWPDYTVDLWVFAQYFEQERKRYNDRKREVERVTLKAQQLAKGIVSTATHIAGYTKQFDTDDEEIVYQSKAEKTQRKRA